MSRFRIAPAARADLDGVWDYIAIQKQSPAGAQRQVERLFEKFSTLARHPLLGEVRDDLGQDVRALAAGSYVILYRPAAEAVEIARVLHAARNLKAALQERRPP